MKTLFILAMCLGLFCQSVSLAKQPAPERGYLTKDKTLSGKFIQNRFLNGFKAPLKTNGEFYLVPELGLAWIVKAPFASRLLMTQDGILQITNGSAVKTGDGRAARLIAGILYPALFGDWEQLKKDFDIEEQPLAGADKAWEFTLHPLNDRVRTFVNKLVVKGKETTQSVVLFRSGGDRDEIQFVDQKVWDKPPSAALTAFSELQGE